MRPGLSAAATFAVLAVLAATACTSDHATSAKPSASPTASPTPTATRTTPPPRPRPKPKVDPLTGRSAVPHGPVIAVKIDNTARSRPQIGLEAASVVYVEQVEGGATRLVAVYAGHYPRRVGPVRSVRRSDPELLSAYGHAALAFSGGAGGPLAALHHSALLDAAAGPYYRIGRDIAPYNLVVNLQALAGQVNRRAAKVTDVGFSWSRSERRLARAARAIRVSTVMGRTRVSFGWDAPLHRYLELVNGAVAHTAAGVAVSTPNVIVQFCRVRPDRGNVDVLGFTSPYTNTVGSGPAVLFRDGRAIPGTWVRPKAGFATRYYDRSGAQLTLRPGGVWVVLVPTGSPLSYH